ncbi:MAG: hypothetical protein ACREGA_02455 [Candidatus Saccharimonadales bacterium]
MEQKFSEPAQDALPANAPPDLPIYTDVDKVPLTLLEQMSGHWRAMYLAKKRRHDVSIKQIVWGQLLTVVIIGGASFFVQRDAQSLLLVGGALIIYPAIASLFSSNATALSASLHHELADSDSIFSRQALALLARSLAQALAVSLLASIVIGLLSGLLGAVLFSAGFWPTFELAVLVAGATGLVGFPLALGLVFLIRKLQSNPDDVAAPAANTIFSLLPLLFIVIISRLIT